MQTACIPDGVGVEEIVLGSLVDKPPFPVNISGTAEDVVGGMNLLCLFEALTLELFDYH